MTNYYSLVIECSNVIIHPEWSDSPITYDTIVFRVCSQPNDSGLYWAELETGDQHDGKRFKIHQAQLEGMSLIDATD